MPDNSEAESPTDEPTSFVPPDPGDLERLLPQYGITSLIAHGGMGAVYAGVQRDLDRPVAIKVLPPDAGRDQESIDRFRTEARAMARLTHPNIPAVYEFTVVQEFCILVMELVEGPNVYTLIRQGNLKPDQALEILAQVCDAVQFAHSRGIIHGDIKPGNILLNQDGMVKLADFGLARLMEHGDRGSELWTPMGTPEYAAPELYDRSVNSDHRADIYSLGVVLHEMLTGSPPVGEFELPAESLGLDSRVDDLIAKCMELKPEARYQSAQEVKALLREIIEHRNVPAAAPAKSAARKVFRASRRNPAGIRRRPQGAAPAPRSAGPVSQPVGSARASSGPPTVTRPPAGGGRGKAGRRVRKVVVVEGSRGGLSDDTKRNILIALTVVVLIVFISLLAGKGKNPDNSKPAGGSESTDSGTDGNSGTANPPEPADPLPPPPRPGGTSPGTTASTPPPPGPKSTPDPRPNPKPDNKAEPVPSKAIGLLHEMRINWRDEWNTKVESKVSDALTRVSSQYTQALQKLEAEFLGKGDAASVLAVRAEIQRYQTANEPVKADAVSKIAKIASVQTALSGQIERIRASVKYDADSVKEKYLLALRELERRMDDADDKAGSKLATDEFEKVTRMSDADLRAYFNAD